MTASRTAAAPLRRVFAAVLAMVFVAFAFKAEAVTVKVDSSQNWIGYMNYLNLDATYKPGGSAWGVADLRAGFTKTNANAWPLNDWLWVKPNTNTYNASEPFWNLPDGSPQTLLEQNFYVDVFTNFAGQTVTFEGTVGTNNYSVPTDPAFPTNGYTAYAVIKEFTSPGYGWVGITQQVLTAGSPFSLSRSIPAGGVVQYGIMVIGPNAGPGAGDPTQGISVAVEDADPAFSTQPVGTNITTGSTLVLTATAIGNSAVSYLWKKDGVALVNGGAISGATSDTLTITPVGSSDAGDYTVEATNLAGTEVSLTATVGVVNVIVTENPVNLRALIGSTAEYSGAATSQISLSYRWFYTPFTVAITNLGTPLFDGGNVAGATTTNLILSNVDASRSGWYRLRFYDGSDFVYSDPAELYALTPAEFANAVDNAGFEQGKLNENPWFRFYDTGNPINPVDFGQVVDANDTYFLGGNVSIQSGTYSSFTGFAAPIQGIYQDADAKPGDVFRADMYFYNPSGDPLPGTADFATNRIYIEVQFRLGEGVLEQYTSEILTGDTIPQNQWIQYAVTNGGDYGYQNPNPPDGPYLVAPENTEYVRFQITMIDDGGSADIGGSLYYDSARLMLKIPVALAVVDNGGNVDISWESQGGTDYQVQSTDAVGGTWTDVEVVAGDGSLITKNYPVGPGAKYYRVLTL